MVDFTDLKERIAICNDFTPQERDFLLNLVNTAVHFRAMLMKEHAKGFDVGRQFERGLFKKAD